LWLGKVVRVHQRQGTWLAGPPAAVAEIVRLDDAMRSQALHHSKIQSQHREEERLERGKRKSQQLARKQRPMKAKSKPLIAQDIFAQLIGRG